MNNLSNTIEDYFWKHFEELPLDKQLHFISRLWFWRHDKTARQMLDNLRPVILPTEDVIETLRRIGDGTLLPLRQGSLNVFHLREEYFQRYPALRKTATMLYWGLILDGCYGTDARSRLSEILSLEEMKTMYEQLGNDSEAMAMLSTHAVNFMYLYQRYVEQNEDAPATTTFSDIASDMALYDQSNPLHTQLRIYLLTHTIIGESLFYRRGISSDKLLTYRPIAQQLEDIVGNSLASVNLDNKLEFLVCCKLVNYPTSLEASILTEATLSLSKNGDYLIDTHNANPQAKYTSFDKSEHRNLLYLLATSQSDAK